MHVVLLDHFVRRSDYWCPQSCTLPLTLRQPCPGPSCPPYHRLPFLTKPTMAAALARSSPMSAHNICTAILSLLRQDFETKFRCFTYVTWLVIRNRKNTNIKINLKTKLSISWKLQTTFKIDNKLFEQYVPYIDMLVAVTLIEPAPALRLLDPALLACQPIPANGQATCCITLRTLNIYLLPLSMICVYVYILTCNWTKHFITWMDCGGVKVRSQLVVACHRVSPWASLANLALTSFDVWGS